MNLDWTSFLIGVFVGVFVTGILWIRSCCNRRVEDWERFGPY